MMIDSFDQRRFVLIIFFNVSFLNQQFGDSLRLPL
jgi:hypothetical protein